MSEARTNRQPYSEALLKEVASFDTATLHEAAGQTGALSPDIRPIAAGLRLAGPALTVACPAGDNLMIHAAVADAQPGEVLIAQCHDHRRGVWGEILMTAAVERGITGLVVDGGVRDVPGLRAAGFPVFCRAIAIQGTVKERRGLLRQPISCGGVLVWPGDLVVADDSGVVVIAADEVEQVVTRARQRVAKENDMLTALRDGKTTVELLGLRGTLDKLGVVRTAGPGLARHSIS